MAEDKLPTRAEDFAEWYNKLVLKADMADYSPVRGCMVVKPYGWTLWENMQAGLDRRFKETGHVNAAFPMLIPLSFFEKEKEHVEGFAPELAVVTHGGGEELEEKLVVRPTSETIIGHMYAKWIKSWRDLPILINQWGSVLRWELRTKLFLRTAEFYWQEGHTAHATAEEATEETFRMLDVYADFAINDCAIPVIKGVKTEKENTLEYCYTTSWGLSTRMIGAIIMTHGDDQGLILPPKVAPLQAVIVPIYKTDEEKTKVMEAADKAFAELKSAGIRVKMDDRDGVTPGFKFNDWEMRGVPVRIEIGPKDVEKGSVALARRDVAGREGKSFVPQTGLASIVSLLLSEIHDSLLKRATEFRDANIHDPKSYEELKQVVADGWAFSYWCEDKTCEAKIKEDTKATARCIPLEGQPESKGRCIVCDKEAEKKVLFGGVPARSSRDTGLLRLPHIAQPGRGAVICPPHLSDAARCPAADRS